MPKWLHPARPRCAVSHYKFLVPTQRGYQVFSTDARCRGRVCNPGNVSDAGQLRASGRRYPPFHSDHKYQRVLVPLHPNYKTQHGRKIRQSIILISTESRSILVFPTVSWRHYSWLYIGNACPNFPPMIDARRTSRPHIYPHDSAPSSDPAPRATLRPRPSAAS